MKLRCIIVDDSCLQRLPISKMIKSHPQLFLVGEYNNVPKARQVIENNKVDLIFLDIEMPLLSGFDLLDRLKNRPGIIFITGKSKYAIKAFDYEAIDFLQKPITKIRFQKAADKAVLSHRYAYKKYLYENGEYIFVKSNFTNHKVFLSSVLYIEASKDYVQVVTDFGSYLVLSSMGRFHERLPKNQFVRIHKSYIVNIDRVETFSSKDVSIEDKLLPLSRNRKANLEKTLLETSKRISLNQLF